MELQQIIGGNIKEIRKKKNLTLDAAAKQTGISRSMLAQIEKGDVNPTISVLWKIANGFKVSFTSLMHTQEEGPLLIRADEVTPLIESVGKYVNYPAFPFQEHKSFETYRIHIEPDGFLEAQPHMTGTEEYITVFSGNVEIIVGDESFRLFPGDSLRFRADIEHTYRNIGQVPVELSMLIYYAKE